MAIDKRLFAKYNDDVKVAGSRRDFPTGTFVAVLDKFESLETDDGLLYLKSHWTILAVERGEADVGAQCSVAYFKRAKQSFFERDTKRCARVVRGLDEVEANALKKETVLEILSNEAPGCVMRLRCKANERQKKGEEDGVMSKWTDVEYVGRLDKDEILDALGGDKKLLKSFFPQGLDETGRGVGFGDDEDGDEAPAPKRKARPVADEDEDEAPAPKRKARPVADEDDEE